MSKAPWSSDRELDAARVRTLLESSFPEVNAEEVRFLAEGWDSQVFEVDGGIVFRFPKRAEVERDFIGETALLPALARHLAAHGAGFRVPAFDYLGQAGELFPYRWVGYAKLEGEQAVSVAPERAPADLAEQLGRALTALHAFPIEQARALGVAEPLPSRAVGYMRERGLALLEGLEASLGGDLTARVRAELSASLLPEYEGPLVLVHNDLRSEHILLESGTHALSGIIDWSDAALGDPAVDFVGVEEWGGPAFTDRVIAAYRGPLDGQARARIRLRALCVSIYTAQHALKNGQPEAVIRAAIL